MVRRIKDDPRSRNGHKTEMQKTAYCESYGYRNVTPDERDHYYNLDFPDDGKQGRNFKHNEWPAHKLEIGDEDDS